MMKNQIAKQTYQKTIEDISVIYECARKTLTQAYWEIGKRIVEVEQDGKIRAEYGTNLLEKISKDLSTKYGEGFSVDNLENMRRFYLTNKNSETSRKLDWSHYVALLSVEDDKIRMKLETEATQKNLTTNELREKIKQTVETFDSNVSNNKTLHATSLQKPTNLELNTYAIAKNVSFPTHKKIIDCGFFFYKPTSSQRIKIVDKPSYTYKAVVERVVDGDTLWAVVDLGLNSFVREKFRFRGIDTPELGTKKGEEAKQYVSNLLKPKQKIIIKTSKSEDKYGRFLADILYSTTPMRVRDLITRGIYLNGQLLEEGFAKIL